MTSMQPLCKKNQQISIEQTKLIESLLVLQYMCEPRIHRLLLEDILDIAKIETKQADYIILYNGFHNSVAIVSSLFHV